MTDKEEFINFFKKFNIPYHFIEDFELENGKNIIRLLADDGDKMEGYREFFCDIKFDDKDNFIKFGIWE